MLFEFVLKILQGIPFAKFHAQQNRVCVCTRVQVCVSFKRFANGLKTNKTVIIHHVLVAELRRYDITHSAAETGFVMKSETAFI